MTRPHDRRRLVRATIRSLVTLTAALGLLASSAIVTQGAEAPDLAQRLSDAGRPEADVARDPGRKPAEVVQFLGIGDGATVIDLIAASGYYTEVLSVAVGDAGKVYAHNTEFTLTYREGANDKAMTKRLADARLPNVERLDREIADLGLQPDSVDAALTALNFHDIYNGGSPEAAVRFLNGVANYLKPGGLLGVIDHAGDPGAPNADLHRMTEAEARQSIAESVLVLEAESDVLRNPADDRSKSVFDPAIRGHTDRFVYLLRKPR